MIVVPTVFWGQSHELLVPKSTTTQVFLNEVILGDTLSTGARIDTLRVYVLERDGFYYSRATIRNTGWAVRIKAQSGAGAKPSIILYKNINVTPIAIPGNFLDIRGNVSLKNVILNGIDETDTTNFSLMNGALLTSSAAGFDIVVDSCILMNVNGNHIRTDGACRVVKVTNTIFGNMGYLGRSNLGAGKGLDLRAGSCDTLLIQNCTFINYQDRIIRHYQSTADLKVLIFDHNTIVNGMSYHGTLSLGKVGTKVRITNNLFIDPFALGNDTDYVRQAEFGDTGEKDQFGGSRMVWVMTVPNTTTSFSIKNNFYSVSSDGQTFLTANGLTEAKPLSWHINGKLGADSTTAFTKVTLPLTKVPKLMVDMMTWYRKPIAQGGAGKTKATGTFNRLLHDYDRKGLEYYRDTVNCGYSTSASAYTGDVYGYPVGDLNWFPGKYAEWKADIRVSVGKDQSGIPVTCELQQNYPNPFNPTTRINFSTERTGLVTIQVFDLLGRHVATLVDEVKPAGKHTVDFNASSFTSGLYIYRLSSGNVTIAKKMLLMK
jgi:hypothetical protein